MTNANILNKHFTETELLNLFQGMMPQGIGVQRVEFAAKDTAVIYFDDVVLCNKVQFILQKHIPFDAIGPKFFSFQDRDTVAIVLTMFKDQIASQIKQETVNNKISKIMNPLD